MTARTKPAVSRQPVPNGYGSVRSDEILPLRELARRLGWGQRTIRQAQRDGLRVIGYGRMKYALGGDVLGFFARLADEQEARA